MSSTADTPPESDLCILHVDDEPGLGELVKLHLEREASGIDCRVTTVTSPHEALSLVRADGTDFDCLVSDYNMPGMNGIELSEAVRETRPDLSILLFSREETEDVATEIVEAGLTDYLRKGMGTEQYTMLVRRVGHAVESGGSFDRRGDTSLDAVGVVGPDDHFERIDERYASVYGYDTDALEGRHWTALHPEEEVEHIRSNVLPVVEDGGKWMDGVSGNATTAPRSRSRRW